ncbi:ABC transporter substrate-binding protein [Desulfovibrio sp. OttesenSCG-928-M14]|nr:ABC transporter substrate-binding protein [Desulfovibrio sp. OttesenSCG-928-M14]
MIQTLTRVAALCLVASFLLLPAPALAASSEARIALENTINQVLNELKKPELKNPASRDAVLARVETIVRDLFSFEELSMRTVGPGWKNFSADQKKRFIDAFEDLLRERYLSSLEGYSGETVAYTGEIASTKGDRVEIQTTVNFKDKPALVAYRMLKKQRWMVYDVIIEGVSMVQNYRTQFQDMLAKGDAEALIRAVRTKADESRAAKNKG